MKIVMGVAQTSMLYRNAPSSFIMIADVFRIVDLNLELSWKPTIGAHSHLGKPITIKGLIGLGRLIGVVKHLDPVHVVVITRGQDHVMDNTATMTGAPLGPEGQDLDLWEGVTGVHQEHIPPVIEADRRSKCRDEDRHPGMRHFMKVSIVTISVIQIMRTQPMFHLHMNMNLPNIVFLLTPIIDLKLITQLHRQWRQDMFLLELLVPT